MPQNFGILAMIQQGYYATYPLLFISVASLAVIFERVWALSGVATRAAKIADGLVAPLRQGKFDEALQQTQARQNPAQRIFYPLISAAQSLNRDQLLPYGYADPAVYAQSLVENGSTYQLYLIWWVNGSDWEGQPTVSSVFREIYQSGNIAIYAYEPEEFFIASVSAASAP